MGLMLAEPDFHTRCFVEWEEYPRRAIIAAQRAGYFAPAPIWDDLRSFDGRPFRGAIDTILAGYPCQPFSQAGKRLGADDPRHLWPHVSRVIGEVEPEWVFLENVAGHITLGAETVLRALWDMGYTPAAGTFSAAETGATHERLRWFCVAHRDGHDRIADSGEPNAPTDRRNQSVGGGGNELDERDVLPLFPPCPDDRESWAAVMAASPDRAPSFARRDALAAAVNLAAILGPDEAEAIEPRLRGLPRGAGMASVVREAPALVDKAQAFTRIRNLADGLAGRPRALRLLGNGVHPLAAAHAWRSLASAHGLGPVDLEAEASATGRAADGYGVVT